MTAFDRAWRRREEDSMIDNLQQAYDEIDGYENVQHFIHVADPIEIFMPNSDKPQKMFRGHLEPTNLVNDKGEYLDSEESWGNMQEDIENLARPRKNPKKSKYARIFLPNPESKRDKIGDFHLDESKSEEWQEKLASEQMTAFDRAWTVVKAPRTLEEIAYYEAGKCPSCEGTGQQLVTVGSGNTDGATSFAHAKELAGKDASYHMMTCVACNGTGKPDDEIWGDEGEMEMFEGEP